jgi:5-enolpyruvylshikimate-3-phosphate synthase
MLKVESGDWRPNAPGVRWVALTPEVGNKICSHDEPATVMSDYSLMFYLLAAGAITLVGGVAIALLRALRAPRSARR